MQIFILREGQQYGPYTAEQARSYVESGDLQADDLAWHEGAVDWLPLQHLLGEMETSAPEAHAPMFAGPHGYPGHEAAPSPEPEPPLQGTPDWVPPRRDGLTPEPSPVVAATRRRESTPLPEPLPPAAPEPGEPGEPGDVARRRGPRAAVFNPERKRAVRAIYTGGIFIALGICSALYTFLEGVHPPLGTYAFAGFAVIAGAIRTTYGLVLLYQV
jgi:hypothetical protein